MHTPYLGAKDELRTRKLSRGFIWVAAVIAACLCPALTSAQTVVNDNWLGGEGTWSNPANWGDGVPKHGGGYVYNVVINTGDGPPCFCADEVELDQNATIASLQLGGDDCCGILSMGVETFTVTGDVTILSYPYSMVENDQTLFGMSGSTVTVGGNFTNYGYVGLDAYNEDTTLTVTGTFTNNVGGYFDVGVGYGDVDYSVASVGTLVNNGILAVGAVSTLNLTNQPNGITDVPEGSTIELYGTIMAGANNGLANLASIEGTLELYNGQTTTVTPGSGTLTVSSSGLLDLESSTTLTVNGNLSNSGIVETNTLNAGSDTLTVMGTFTNQAGAQLNIGRNDVMNTGTLANNGALTVDTGATLNLTNQPNGITDVPEGSTIELYGTIMAGANNGLANLASIEGTLELYNGRALTLTTLTVSTTGFLDLENGSSLSLTNLTNSGLVATDYYGTTPTTLTVAGSFTNQANGIVNIEGSASTLTVTGTFTNKADGQLIVGKNEDTTDVANIGMLINDGYLYIGQGATLNLTNLANGVTDVVKGSTLDVRGTLNVINDGATSNGLANLITVAGTLILENGKSTTMTPNSGTLTVIKGGLLRLDQSTSVAISGNLTNSGTVSASYSMGENSNACS